MNQEMDGMPLAARMRPSSFDEFFGQRHLVAPDAAFRKAVEAGRLGSIILWGPPGVGKTTLAEIVASVTDANFERVSATSAGVADLRKIVEVARGPNANRRSATGSIDLFSDQRGEGTKRRTILFIDEIHRFNKAQQDAILPVVEDGTITLIGATTENPSFEVNSALLSRARVYVLNALSDDDIRAVLHRALKDAVRGLGGRAVQIEGSAEDALIGFANGDARASLNMLELCVAVSEASRGNKVIDLAIVESAIQRRTLLYDKGGEAHFDLISALHKTVRGSDVDASLYWLARILQSGEDPLYVARRVIRMASEDIGLADPQALVICLTAQQSVHFVGMPEGALALAQAVAYLAAAPKSNALYVAYSAAVRDVEQTRNDPVPLHLRNAPTRLMSELGYGDGYKYAHDYEDAVVYQQNLPDGIADHQYYSPTSRGFEKELTERIRNWKQRIASTGPNPGTAPPQFAESDRTGD